MFEATIFIPSRACGQQKEDRETRLDRRWKERPLENAKNLRPVRNAARIHGKSNSHQGLHQKRAWHKGTRGGIRGRLRQALEPRARGLLRDLDA